MNWTVRMRMRKLFLPRHSRGGATSVESLVTKLFNARVTPSRHLATQIKADMVEEVTM